MNWTEYQKLQFGELLGAQTVEIRLVNEEFQNNRNGVAGIDTDGRVAVFYGADDGSDDMIISAAKFNKLFKVTSIIF